MKRLYLSLLCGALVSAPTAVSAEPLWVQVKTSQLRSAPEFFAPAVLAVRYGDSVERLGESDGWVRVSARGKTGYLPLSAVTEKEVVLSSRDAAKVKADPSEVVLAGKGFSKEVEERFKRSDSSARFDLVDQIERKGTVDRQEVKKFVKAGGLNG